MSDAIDEPQRPRCAPVTTMGGRCRELQLERERIVEKRTILDFSADLCERTQVPERDIVQRARDKNNVQYEYNIWGSSVCDIYIGVRNMQ